MGDNKEYRPGPIFELMRKFWEADIEEGFSHLEVHLYFKLVEINNRLGWKETFRYANSRLESEVGTRSKNLIAARQRLVEAGLISYQKGNTRNAGTYSLLSKLQSIEPTKESNQESKEESNQGNINKTKLNQTKPNQIRVEETLTLEVEFYPFEEFWEDYDKKRGDKEKLKRKWAGIGFKDRRKIKDFLPLYKKSEPDKQFRKDPGTFLNQKAWNDEIIERNEYGKKYKGRNGFDSEETRKTISRLYEEVNSLP